MSEFEYFRGSFKAMRVEEDHAGKKSLIVNPKFAAVEVDSSDEDNVSALAYNARKNANDLYNLVMEKYKGNAPADIPGFEMLVALINFSSELYLKCLIYHYRLNQGKLIKFFHEIDGYFSKLPEDVQTDLKAIDKNFDTHIKMISNYFNDFRYSFEFNAVSSISFAFSFAEKLNQICNAIKIDRPSEIVYSDNRLLVKHGDRIVWDSSKNHEYEYPIVSKND